MNKYKCRNRGKLDLLERKKVVVENRNQQDYRLAKKVDSHWK
jgi:hypothetical protein